MKVNLSLVLDENGEVRLDLISNEELRLVDEYTSGKINHDEIRKDYQKHINSFLELNKNYIAGFKRENNKKGSIVITFIDEFNKFRKLRVLYKKNANKLDTDKLINKIYSSLKKADDIDKTIEVIDNYSNLIFNSDFEKKTIISNKRKLKDVRTIENIEVRTKKIKLINNNLLLLIKNRFIYLNTGSSNHQEIGYYYLRLIDSYIEKHFKIATTREISRIKKGKLEIDRNNIATVKEKSLLIKNNISFNGQILHEEDNGQLSMFDVVDCDNVKHERTKIKDSIF